MNARFYRYANWKIADDKPDVFNEISRDIALGYFSGHADGLGFADFPKDYFSTLSAALVYVTEKRAECVKETQRGIYADCLTDTDENDDLLRALAEDLEIDASKPKQELLTIIAVKLGIEAVKDCPRKS